MYNLLSKINPFKLCSNFSNSNIGNRHGNSNTEISTQNQAQNSSLNATARVNDQVNSNANANSSDNNPNSNLNVSQVHEVAVLRSPVGDELLACPHEPLGHHPNRVTLLG